MARKRTYKCNYCDFETENLYGSYLCPRCRHVLKPTFNTSPAFPLKGLVITGVILAILWLLLCLVGKADFTEDLPYIIAFLAVIELLVFFVFFFIALGKKAPKKIAVFGMLICLVVFIISCVFVNHTNTDSTENVFRGDVKKEDNAEPIPSIKHNTEIPKPTKEEYISQCMQVEYESVARNPDQYKNTSISFKGKVIQVLEGSTVNYRVAQENSKDAQASDTWIVLYKPSKGESRILEGDTIVVYGRCTGLATYTAIFGQKITVPCVEMKYYELLE